MSNSTENKPRPNLVGSPNISLHSSEEKKRKKLVETPTLGRTRG